MSDTAAAPAGPTVSRAPPEAPEVMPSAPSAPFPDGRRVSPEVSPAKRVVRPPKSGMRRALPWIVAIVVVYFGLRAGLSVWRAHQFRLPAGIIFGNGRLEADEIDIDTKFAARIAELYVNEGDLVHAGQALARMDTRDLEAQRRTAEAQVLQAVQAVAEDSANVLQQRTQLELARSELARYRILREQDFVTEEELDQRQQTYDAAVAALSAASARTAQAHHALDAARHTVELLQVNIADDTLRAPRDGRIEYRIANVGEVLGAGGKVFTMLDATSVYMDIFLPTADAGRVRLGSDARIVLDAVPQHPIPAFVSYLASQAQFTPKAVETKSERDKLMFRVKVRIDPRLLAANEEAVRTGLPGVAYVRLDSTVAWPAPLTARSSARTTQ